MRSFVVALPALLFLWGTQPIRADFGPKLMSQVRVDVTLEGRPLPDNTTAALLSPAAEAGSGPSNSAAYVPQLPIPYTDGAGSEWNYAGYLWGGRFQNGKVTFKGFQDFRFRDTAPNGLPSKVRLAVFDAEAERLYVSAPVSPGKYLSLMRAELGADGSITLKTLHIPFWQRFEFWKALLITLVVECVIVGFCFRSKPARSESTPTPRRGRLFVVCILANLFTLPLVWFVGGHYLFTDGLATGTAAVLVLEFGAFLVEGTAYLAATKRPGQALLAALLANLATFLLGFLL